MQILNQTQRNTGAYGFSETLMAQTQLQFQAIGGSAATGQAGNTADQVTLSPGATASNGANGQNDLMTSLQGMIENILQQVLGTSLTTVASTTQSNAANKSGQNSDSQNAPSSPLDQLTASIMTALQGNNSSQAAQSGGSQNSLLSALSSMGNSVQNDALSLFNNLSAQNQSLMHNMTANAAAQGASGSYESDVSVAESERYDFTASGKITMASGQAFQFSLQVDLQASVQIASRETGTFGPQSQNGQDSQNNQNGQDGATQNPTLQLGQQAGLFAGADVAFSLQNLLAASLGNNSQTTGAASGASNASGTNRAGGNGSSTSSSAAGDSGSTQTDLASLIGREITSALATLTLTPQNSGSKQQTLPQQQISALLQHKHGQHA
ncbi:MAG: hypothetical protein JO171_18850, partial [Paludibacterium sp.]|uniref:hypothetical protein n=1 Tax=Paludibacterium sp. TaxID=1917523 RepID=UPI0025FCB6D6